MQRRLISDEEPASRISLQLLGLHGHLAMRMALSSQSERESISEPKEASGCLREIVTATGQRTYALSMVWFEQLRKCGPAVSFIGAEFRNALLR